MASKTEHMKTKALLAAKKNASCMVKKPFKSVEMEALLLFIKFQKCADLQAQQEDSNSLNNKATARADVTSVPKDFECETNVTIGKYNDLQVRFDSHKGATSDGVPSQPAAVCGNGAARRHAFAALQVSSHTYPDRSCSKSFQTLANEIFTLQTTIPSKTTVNNHMEPTKYQHRRIKAIFNSEGDRSENVLNISYLHFSHSPYSKLNRDMQKLVATISTRVVAKPSTNIFLMPATHTRIVATRVSRVLVLSSTAAAR